jgi:hypothetical protein
MEAIEREQSDGIKWLLGAGTVAVLIASFVAWSDWTLTNSTSERELGRSLHELRSAQTSLARGAVDSRQRGQAVLREPAAPAVLAAGKTHRDHSH